MTGRSVAHFVKLITRRPIAAACTRLRHEGGFSLVEELVALSVVALGLTMLLGMIGTGSRGVVATTDQVTAEGLARSQLELIKAAAYQPNPTSVPYPTMAAPTPYSLQVGIEYWNASATPGGFDTTVRNDGMQKIVVRVMRGTLTVLQVEDFKVHR